MKTKLKKLSKKQLKRLVKDYYKLWRNVVTENDAWKNTAVDTARDLVYARHLLERDRLKKIIKKDD